MNSGGHKNAVKTLVSRPFDVRAHGVADGENARAIRFGPSRSIGDSERELVNRSKRLASLNHFSAEPRITLGDRPRAIGHYPVDLDHEIRIGADKIKAAVVHALQPRVVISRRLAPEVDEAGAQNEVRALDRGLTRRLASQSRHLVEEAGFLRRAYVEQALSRSLHQQGDGDIAGRNDAV